MDMIMIIQVILMILMLVMVVVTAVLLMGVVTAVLLMEVVTAMVVMITPHLGEHRLGGFKALLEELRSLSQR